MAALTIGWIFLLGLAVVVISLDAGNATPRSEAELTNLARDWVMDLVSVACVLTFGYVTAMVVCVVAYILAGRK